MTDYDLIVIGGGPAGSVCSALVAEDGHRVLLLEREEFPRHHIGESLIPAVVPILRRLGVTDELERRGYLRKKGTTFRWGADSRAWTIGFAENHPRLSYSYQVLRSDFDEILLGRARAGGVDVRTGHEVVDVDVESPTEAQVVYRDERGRTHTASARFIVDASGRKGVVTTKLQQRRFDPELRNMAIYAYFRDAKRLEPPCENNTLVEGYDEGWFWHIPLHVGVVSVGTVIELDRNQRIPKTELATALHERIGRTTMVAEMLAGASMVEGPYLLSDWSYVSEAFWGPKHVVVGDAACFVDPLFSTGVHLATQGAVTAAACLNSILRGERRPEQTFPYYDRSSAAGGGFWAHVGADVLVTALRSARVGVYA